MGATSGKIGPFTLVTLDRLALLGRATAEQGPPGGPRIPPPHGGRSGAGHRGGQGF